MHAELFTGIVQYDRTGTRTRNHELSIERPQSPQALAVKEGGGAPRQAQSEGLGLWLRARDAVIVVRPHIVAEVLAEHPLRKLNEPRFLLQAFPHDAGTCGE